MYVDGGWQTIVTGWRARAVECRRGHPHVSRVEARRGRSSDPRRRHGRRRRSRPAPSYRGRPGRGPALVPSSAALAAARRGGAGPRRLPRPGAVVAAAAPRAVLPRHRRAALLLGPLRGPRRWRRRPIQVIHVARYLAPRRARRTRRRSRRCSLPAAGMARAGGRAPLLAPLDRGQRPPCRSGAAAGRRAGRRAGRVPGRRLGGRGGDAGRRDAGQRARRGREPSIARGKSRRARPRAVASSWAGAMTALPAVERLPGARALSVGALLPDDRQRRRRRRPGAGDLRARAGQRPPADTAPCGRGWCGSR